LRDLDARQAKESYQVPLVINSDAHEAEGLEVMRYGVAVARRAWLRPADVLNTWPLADLQAWISARRSRAAGVKTSAQAG
jgi:DNA polymerase (family 10)